MAHLNPKQFIQATFINDLGRMLESNNFYLAFMIMSIGIEFLGKCINNNGDWHNRASGKTFNSAIKNLTALKAYKHLLKGNGSYDLYSSLRCGLAHAAAPKFEITLSSTDQQTDHLVEMNGRVNLKCENFYSDFKKACEEIIAMEFSDNKSKMNKPFLEIPGKELNQYTQRHDLEAEGTGSFSV